MTCHLNQVHRIFFLLLFLAGLSTLPAQQFDFERNPSPFPVTRPGGVVYQLPFLGGLNEPIQQFVDIDGDDDPDLFVQDRDRPKQLTFFRNAGDPGNYLYQWETDSFENLNVGAWFKFADADGDGDYDLFTEKPFDYIRYYRNDGSEFSPLFVLATDTLKDTAGSPIKSEALSVPEWADIDCDSDLDLFIGQLSGYIAFYRRIGPGVGNIPTFEFVTATYQNIRILTGGAEAAAAAGIDKSNRHGANSLTFVDIDGDLDNDLFWGDFFAESIIFLENIGTCQNALFDTNLILEEYPPNDPILTGGFNVPRFADVDGDSDIDMFVGVLGGFNSPVLDKAENFYYYENTGSPLQPDFILRSKQFLNDIDIGKNSIPGLVDIDGDNDLDLFLSNQEDLNVPQQDNSRIYFFENTGSPGQPAFALANTNFLGEDKPGEFSYSPAFADIDADGDFDMFLGKFFGQIIFYSNDGSSASPAFVRVTNNYAGIDVGNNSTPAFADIDDDSDLDLFIGEFGGNINFYRNDGNSAVASFVLDTTHYFGISLGIQEYSHPYFSDIDHDGDYDLFIGSETKGIWFYRNQGTPQNANFIRDMTFQLPQHFHTSPRLADIDGDGDLDLFSGSRTGGVLFYENREVVIAIDPPAVPNSVLPQTIRLLGNFPNPFNPRTTIEYELNISTALSGKFHTLTIYNVLGQTVLEWRIPNGGGVLRRQISWDGRDASGSPVPSGIYFYQLRVDAHTSASGKMLLAR